MHVTLDNDRAAKAWTIVFDGSTTMPNRKPIPLPFTNDATVLQVATHVRSLFPEAAILVRQRFGLPFHAYV